MTKLVQWLTRIILFLGMWYMLITSNIIPSSLELHAWLIPVYAVLLFGVVSAGIVLRGVFSFNDCPDAAHELRTQIKQAKEELRKKGMVFDSED